MSSDLHHLAAAFALDALDPDERRAFEAHYPTCELCRDEVIDFREAAAHLAAATEVQPSADLRSRILGEIETTRQLPPLVAPTPIIRRVPRQPLLLAVAAALVVVLGMALVLRPADRTSDFDRVFAAPDAVLTSLEGEQGEMQVLWSASLDEAVVFGNDVADLTDEQAYALWFVTDDGVLPAGLFSAEDGRVRESLDLADIDPNGWGITIEPAGGSPQPTGDIIYLAEF